MANYYGVTRTNYFHVKDPEAFKKLMDTVVTSEDRISVWNEKDKNGKTIYGFGCYGSILGIEDKDEDCDYDGFIDALSSLVAEDDAIIILESGNEKLRYLVGSAMIVTSKDSEYLEIGTVAAERVASILGRQQWLTKMWY